MDVFQHPQGFFYVQGFQDTSFYITAMAFQGSCVIITDLAMQKTFLICAVL